MAWMVINARRLSRTAMTAPMPTRAMTATDSSLAEKIAASPPWPSAVQISAAKLSRKSRNAVSNT